MCSRCQFFQNLSTISQMLVEKNKSNTTFPVLTKSLQLFIPKLTSFHVIYHVENKIRIEIESELKLKSQITSYSYFRSSLGPTDAICRSLCK